MPEKADEGCALKVVNIRPRVTVLSVLAHLEYKAWFALAEFVDNSIESFQEVGADIRALEGPDAGLRVEIEVDSGLQRLTIRDNAGGIALGDFPRAFRPAELPVRTCGLSEFGMGMKSASCWFAPIWRIRTSALGEPVERVVTFDIAEIVHDQIEELEVEENKARPNAHYTVVELEELRSIPRGRTSGKIREHLADIYRDFLRSRELELVYRGEALVYEEPETLVAPTYGSDNEPVGDPVEWRKPIDFDLGDGLSAQGFAALRAKGSTRYAGISLFRRRRVIEGSADEKYRPSEIFGAPNSFVSQRLWGELHLEGFGVSHTKDGFQWGESESAFLDLLKEHLNSDDLPLLRQARNYREKAARVVRADVADKAVRSTAEALERHGPDIVPDIVKDRPTDQTPPPDLDEEPQIAQREFTIEVDGSQWVVKLELSPDERLLDWLTLAERVDPRQHTLRVRVGLESPFMKRIVRLDDPEQLEPVVRLAAGLALAEHLSRAGGVRMAGNIRRNLNRLLANALSLGA